jgi:hypothetical protein
LKKKINDIKKKERKEREREKGDQHGISFPQGINNVWKRFMAENKKEKKKEKKM